MSKPIVIEINANLQWLYFRDEPTGHWIAECPPLGIVIEGSTSYRLRENIEHGLVLMFRELVKNNQLDSFLGSHGWSASRRETVTPEMADTVEFDVPFDLVSTANRVDRAIPVH